ncbi:transposase [Bradyrhizobium sp. 160]|nr:transposase [Bradyrhizobium sp. 160]
MTTKMRRKIDAALKARIALEAVREQAKVAAMAGQRQRPCLDARLAVPRRMTAMLKAEGLQVNRKRVQRLMRKMGIAAPGPKPNPAKPAPGPKIYPICCAT